MANLREISDLFSNKICPKYPQVAEKYGIFRFLEKVDQAAAETGRLGDQMPNLEARIAELHSEASQILQALADNNETEVITIVREYFGMKASQPDSSWVLWYLDTFDSGADEEAKGKDITDGLYQLWDKTLRESIDDSGNQTFTMFRLVWKAVDSSQHIIEVQVKPRDNQNLVKLRQWVYSKNFIQKLVDKKRTLTKNDADKKILQRIVQLHMHLVRQNSRTGPGQRKNDFEESEQLLALVEKISGPDQLKIDNL